MNYKSIIAFSVLIAALAVGYYFVIYIPQRDNTERMTQEKIQSEKNVEQIEIQSAESARRDKQKVNLENCLNNADLDATAFWNKNCTNFGTDTKKEDCLLPQYYKDSVDKLRTDEKDTCFKLFPQN